MVYIGVRARTEFETCTIQGRFSDAVKGFDRDSGVFNIITRKNRHSPEGNNFVVFTWNLLLSPRLRVHTLQQTQSDGVQLDPEHAHQLLC